MSGSPIADSRIISLNTTSPGVVTINGSMKSWVQWNKVSNFVLPTSGIEYITMRLRSATIPNFFYNILSPQLFFNYTSTGTNMNFIVSFASGIYNIYALINTLTTAIIGSGVTLNGSPLASILTVSYNNLTNQVTFAIGNAPAGASNPVLTIYPSTLASQLGFSSIPTNGQILFFNTTIYPTFGPNLSGVTNILMQLLEVRPQNYSTEISSGIFAAIPNDAPLESTRTYYFTDDKAHIVHPQSLNQTMTVYLFDQNGNTLDFKNYDWQMTVELTFYRNDIVPYTDLYTALNQLMAQIQQQQQNAQQAAAQQPQQPVQPPPIQWLPNQLTEIQYMEIPPDLREMVSSTDLALIPPPSEVLPITDPQILSLALHSNTDILTG